MPPAQTQVSCFMSSRCSGDREPDRCSGGHRLDSCGRLFVPRSCDVDQFTFHNIAIMSDVLTGP